MPLPRRSSCASASGSTTRAIGRHRGEGLAAKAVGIGLPQRRSGPLGPRPAIRRGDRPRLQRRDRRRPPAAHPERHRLRLRVRRGPAPGELPAGARGHGACTPSRPSACTATAPGASSAATPGSRRSTTWPISSPTRGCSPTWASTPGGSWWSCAPRPRSRSTTASRIPLFRQVLERLAAGPGPDGGAAAHPGAARRGAAAWAPSPSRSARWTPRAWWPSPTW